jgi:hypothetical protein
MSVWLVIACLVTFSVVWPFLDVAVRNRLKRRERERVQVRVTDA